MPERLTDDQIARLTVEVKRLSADYQSVVRLRPRRGHRHREFDVRGDGGGDFRVILRQSIVNALDFSVILGYQPAGSTEIFRLRRHNGKSHEHTNTLEKERFYDFHIHEATERYQAVGAREDSYARITTRYGHFDGAVRCLLQDCGFIVPGELQARLFEVEP